MAPVDLAADPWRAWCASGQRSTGEEAPLLVLLLAALGTPPGHEGRFLGDLCADLLGSAQTIINRWRTNPNGMEGIDSEELRSPAWQLDAAVELRPRALAGGGAR